MNPGRLVPMLLLSVAPAAAVAQTVIDLDPDDVSFHWRPAPAGAAFCGFAILGNHLKRRDPKVEWDIFIDELVTGSAPVVGVSAGTFDVASHQRKPRAAITDLAFAIDGDSQAISAQLVGAPNADNGVRGVVDLERATLLFEALESGKRITISLQYTDSASEVLRVRPLRDQHPGKYSTFHECLRGKTPRIVNPRPAL